MTTETVAKTLSGRTRYSNRLCGEPLIRRVAPVYGQVYLSVREVAIRSSVAPRTVKRWIAAGILPATRLPSPKGLGQFRIRLVDFEVMIVRGAQS